MRRVLLQAAIPDLDIAELALDNPERVLNLGPNTRLGFFDLFSQGIALVIQIKRARLPGRVAYAFLTTMGVVQDFLKRAARLFTKLRLSAGLGTDSYCDILVYATKRLSVSVDLSSTNISCRYSDTKAPMRPNDMLARLVMLQAR